MTYPTIEERPDSDSDFERLLGRPAPSLICDFEIRNGAHLAVLSRCIAFSDDELLELHSQVEANIVTQYQLLSHLIRIAISHAPAADGRHLSVDASAVTSSSEEFTDSLDCVVVPATLDPVRDERIISQVRAILEHQQPKSAPCLSAILNSISFYNFVDKNLYRKMLRLAVFDGDHLYGNHFRFALGHSLYSHAIIMGPEWSCAELPNSLAGSLRDAFSSNRTRELASVGQSHSPKRPSRQDGCRQPASTPFNYWKSSTLVDTTRSTAMRRTPPRRSWDASRCSTRTSVRPERAS